MSTVIPATRNVFGHFNLNTKQPKQVHLLIGTFMPLFHQPQKLTERPLTKLERRVVEQTYPGMELEKDDYSAAISYERYIPCSMEEATELICPKYVPLLDHIWVSKFHLDDPDRDFLLYEDDKEIWILHIDGDPRDPYSGGKNNRVPKKLKPEDIDDATTPHCVKVDIPGVLEVHPDSDVSEMFYLQRGTLAVFDNANPNVLVFGGNLAYVNTTELSDLQLQNINNTTDGSIGFTNCHLKDPLGVWIDTCISGGEFDEISFGPNCPDPDYLKPEIAHLYTLYLRGKTRIRRVSTTADTIVNTSDVIQKNANVDDPHAYIETADIHGRGYLDRAEIQHLHVHRNAQVYFRGTCPDMEVWGTVEIAACSKVGAITLHAGGRVKCHGCINAQIIADRTVTYTYDQNDHEWMLG